MNATCDVLVIGAGPAGLAAAATAASKGLRVTLVDEQSFPGGQIHRLIETRAVKAGGVSHADDVRGVLHFAFDGAEDDEKWQKLKPLYRFCIDSL